MDFLQLRYVSIYTQNKPTKNLLLEFLVDLCQFNYDYQIKKKVINFRSNVLFLIAKMYKCNHIFKTYIIFMNFFLTIPFL